MTLTITTPDTPDTPVGPPSARGQGWLPTPGRLSTGIPLGIRSATLVADTRRAVVDIVSGADPRVLVVCGPCSIHDPAAAVDYARELQLAASQLADDLLIVMRAYVEKPRTGLGWRGLVADPGLTGTQDLRQGLVLARATLRGILREGMPTAVEFVDPFVAAYTHDVVCWGAIGARTVESPPHRQLAASLGMPVAFKNRLDGAVGPAVNAATVAAAAQTVVTIDASGMPTTVAAGGNPCPHVVLRGGDRGPNYYPAAVAAAARLLDDAGLSPRVLVDAAHGNSGKDDGRQRQVVTDLAELIADPGYAATGVMIESNLVAGRQDIDTAHPRRLRWGQSITDACIGIDDTRTLLRGLARAAATRRQRRIAARRPSHRTPTASDAALPRPATDTAAPANTAHRAVVKGASCLR